MHAVMLMLLQRAGDLVARSSSAALNQLLVDGMRFLMAVMPISGYTRSTRLAGAIKARVAAAGGRRY